MVGAGGETTPRYTQVAQESEIGIPWQGEGSCKTEGGSHEGSQTNVERKNREMVVSWWNGGGRLIPRIRVNPELTKFISTKPDIFVYGESLTYRFKQSITIPGYKVILHTAKRNDLRRGLAVYYREKYANVITKEKSSKRFDILWIRMKSPLEENIFCFFYASGLNHEEGTREMFYDELRKGVDKFAKEKRQYISWGTLMQG